MQNHDMTPAHGFAPFMSPRILLNSSPMRNPGHRRRILVSDFDGTMTKTDFFDLVRTELPSAATRDYWQEYVDGKITHFEALSGIFASIRTDLPTLERLVDRMDLDPAIPNAIADLHAAGWKIIVASAGCDWYIRHLLGRAGVQIEIHANPGVFSPETGLQLSLPVQSPFYKHETGIDKSAIVQRALSIDAHAAFAGDGRPDLAPARLVDPSRRFARGWLAHHLQKSGEGFRPFDTWSRIADDLLEEHPC
jgi:2-hydroxy-3-keto-5-methylthiopentenyl-1-phosphate phosphatase